MAAGRGNLLPVLYHFAACPSLLLARNPLLLEDFILILWLAASGPQSVGDVAVLSREWGYSL